MDKPKRLKLLQRQAARLENRLRVLNAISERYVRARTALFVGLAALVFVAFSQGSGAAGYTAFGVSVVVFNVVAYYHRRVKASIHRHRLWLEIKRTHSARIRLDWSNIPLSDVTAPPEHPFAVDLDLVGERSLHRLLDTTASREGGQRLRDWLLSSEPDLARITHRQAVIRELRRLTTFRDKLILNGRLASGEGENRIEGRRLLGWFAHRPDTGPGRSEVMIAWGLAGVNLLLLILYSQGELPPLWLGSLLVFLAYCGFVGRETGDIFAQALSLRNMIENMNAVFRFLENYRYGDKPLLKALCAPFADARQRPSAHLRRVGWVITGVSLRGNPVLWFAINLLIPWDISFAYLLNRRKAEIAARLPGWLDAWVEVDVLSALANFAYLNPEYTFPIVSEADSGLRGQQLGHPLIPHEAKVCNDFALTERGSVVIITGSNMAGKSSFLRTLGVNLCLAYAGAPVNALHMQAGLMRLFTCIRVSDSVTDGFSYFYAEVRRLKALLVEVERRHRFPVFFLIDEIFKGTNNRERLIGSRAYIRSLAGRNCLGVVSTHDLELVRLADELPQISNFHFREEVIDGRMSFDYRLRPGPSPTTNALKIMQLEGLPVDVL